VFTPAGVLPPPFSERKDKRERENTREERIMDEDGRLDS